jgi:hypothetical protein
MVQLYRDLLARTNPGVYTFEVILSSGKPVKEQAHLLLGTVMCHAITRKELHCRILYFPHPDRGVVPNLGLWQQ